MTHHLTGLDQSLVKFSAGSLKMGPVVWGGGGVDV